MGNRGHDLSGIGSPNRHGQPPAFLLRIAFALWEASGYPYPESRRIWPAKPWMAQRRQIRVSEAQDGRSERPATGYGWHEAGLGKETGLAARIPAPP